MLHGLLQIVIFNPVHTYIATIYNANVEDVTKRGREFDSFSGDYGFINDANLTNIYDWSLYILKR